MRTNRNKSPVFPGLLISLLIVAVGVDAAEEVQPPPEPAGSRMYRTTDAEGNTVFTDVMTDGATEVELGTTIIYPSDAITQPYRGTDTGAPASGEATAYSYRVLEILEPPPEAVIRNNTGNFVVKGGFSPGLHQDHRIQLLIDGVVYASGQSTLFELENVDRGVHELQLQIVDVLSRKVLTRSPPVRITLMRFSILHPGAKSRN